MPGGGGWYDLDVITANAADIRNGKVAVDRDGDPVVGSMEENPSPTAALNCGQSKVIPEGYNPGGTVTANSLKSQTAGNLDANKLPTGYRGWSNGVLVEGKMAVSSVVSFSVAAYSTSQVLATWKNPAKGPYSGVAICAKTGGYPANINDGRVYTGVGSNSALNAASTAIIGGLAAGTTYYFRIWVYCTVSSGDMYSGYLQASAKTTAHGRQAFTASGTFTVPEDVRSIDIHCTGGGGNGGPTPPYYGNIHGGGGGGGYTSYRNGISVTPGQQVQVTVGAGGDGYVGSAMSGDGKDGGSSSAAVGGVTVTASGGEGGRGSGRENNGGAGGSGGGGGGVKPGDGGADGGSGGDATSQDGQYIHSNGGVGQGLNTREFGSGSGTLYSGGGGGGGGAEYYSPRSAGGAGGGGNGGYYTSYSGPDGHATAGSPGTGGGGGGAYTRSPSDDSAEHVQRGKAAAGGSGNVIIRW